MDRRHQSQRLGLSLLLLLAAACGSSSGPVALSPQLEPAFEVAPDLGSLLAPDELFALSGSDSAVSLLTSTFGAQLGTPYDVVARADLPGQFVTTDFGRRGRLLNVTADGSVSILSTNLGQATGVVQLADNSFVVADRRPGSARLLQIPASGGAATPLSLSASIGQPYGLALTSAGELVVTDFGTAPGNGRLLRVALNGTVTVLATEAVVGNPTDVIETSTGRFVATDFFGQRLVEVDASGALVQAESLSGSRPAGVLELGPNQYAVTDYGLAVGQGRILQVGIGAGVTVLEEASLLQANPYGIAQSGGTLFVTDLLTGRLLEVGEEPVEARIVNTVVDEDGTGEDCSLREAIIANNAAADFGGCTNPNGTIEFEPGLTGTITILNSGLPQITQDVEVKGPGSSTLAVSGNKLFRVFDIGSNLNVTIDGLTITNGSISGSGGGIQAASGTTLTVTNSTSAVIARAMAAGSVPLQ